MSILYVYINTQGCRKYSGSACVRVRILSTPGSDYTCNAPLIVDRLNITVFYGIDVQWEFSVLGFKNDKFKNGGLCVRFASYRISGVVKC